MLLLFYLVLFFNLIFKVLLFLFFLGKVFVIFNIGLLFFFNVYKFLNVCVVILEDILFVINDVLRDVKFDDKIFLNI